MSLMVKQQDNKHETTTIKQPQKLNFYTDIKFLCKVD